MKKLIALLIVCTMLGMTFPEIETQQPVEISTREALQKIAENPSGLYVLTADIDMGDAPWTPIPFSGRLNGGGHTIGNLTVTETGADRTETYDGNRKKYDTAFAGLFSVVRDAEIADLRLLNAKISVETDQDCFIGAIAGYASDTVITNCTVSMRGKLTLSSVNAGTAGMIGFCEDCTFDGCAVDAELIFADVNTEVLCEEFLGGVFSCGYGTVSNCNVVMRGYADVYGYAHNGGVIGMFKVPRDVKKKNFSVNDSTVDAEIRFFEVTPSRRAYCKPIIGEDNVKACHLARNKELHFVREDSRKAEPKRPESCVSPTYSQTVTEPTCDDWGYTTFTCGECGYTYRDNYTLPAHSYEAKTVPATCLQAGKTVYTCKNCGDTYEEPIPVAEHIPGEWIVEKAPGITEEGEETQYCIVCGTLLDRRPIPARGPVLVQNILIDDTVLELHPGETYVLELTVEPYDATDSTVRFESSDPNVVLVDGAGYLSAISTGTATITITSADGNAKASRSVLVTANTPEKEEESFSFFSWLRCG